MRLARVSSYLLFAAAAVGCTSDNDGPNGVPKLQQVRFNETKDVAVSGDLSTSATKYVRANSLITNSGDDWSVRKTSESNGMKHVRMHQMHGGVRVWGGDIVVHTQGDKYSSVAGNRVNDLQGFDIKATVKDDDAMATAKQEYALSSKDPKVALKYQRETSELVILPRNGAETRLAWHVSFYTDLQAGIDPKLMHYFVDAKSGTILDRFNGIHTVTAQASGPGGNEKVDHPWVNQLDVQMDGATYKAETPRLKTFDLQHGTSGGVIATGSLEAFGDAAINDAHGHAENVLNMLDQWQGHNSIDDAGFQIVSNVHYSTNYENAFWDGASMTYGDGESYFYPLSGDVDVVAHEINHGFTSFHSNLTYSGESGGLNESFSDIAGAVTEHFDEGDGADFDVGADIFKEVGAALRYMCDPTADGASIDNYADYAGQDVHYTSGISNKAFCLAAIAGSGGTTQDDVTTAVVQRLSNVWYVANTSYWTESTTFAQACQGTLDALGELGGTDTEKQQLKDAWVGVGVYCDGAVEPLICDDTLTTDHGEVTSPNHPANYPDNFKRTYCIIPASGAAATVTFPVMDTEEGYDFVTVKDGVTGETLSTSSGATAPTDASSTTVVIKFTSDSSVNATGWKATW